ncbi:MAG: RtcB family protein [Acidimicrobiia bacterium]
MRVPGIVFASRRLLPAVVGDRSLDQVANVATLPGVVEASYAMPDVHWGYGFPIGGVAATDIDAGGVVSPGGVGFDISCGVRLLRSDIDRAGLEPVRSALMDQLARTVPTGMGKGAVWEVGSEAELRRVLSRGAVEAVEQGFGDDHDLARCEDGGVLPGADPDAVSERALARGLHQVGSLGSGNHFLEVQVVDRVHDPGTAAALGLHEGQVCVMIHSGSRGLGHQICTDHVRRMEGAMARHGIVVPDRQLACVPARSDEGREYLAAMAAAANYGRANRQLLAAAARRAFAAATGTGDLPLVYDVSHNLAKIEQHEVEGRRRTLCVHRKGATRSLPPHHPDLPDDLAPIGQPVLVPGSMGTASYVLVGVPGGGAFHSSCHGAGRTMSRTAARRQVAGGTLRRELVAAGVAVRGASNRGLAEEAPLSYKDVDEVVTTVEQAGLARRVVRLVPVGVVKG